MYICNVLLEKGMLKKKFMDHLTNFIHHSFKLIHTARIKSDGLDSL